MHTKEELNQAIITLYQDYKDVVDKYKKGDLRIINKLVKISKDETKYTRDEVYYICFNALMLLKEDFKKEKLGE